MKSEIPSEEDWGDYQSDLDQIDAHDVFFGRTNEEMQKEYSRHITARTTDLKFMPAVPFRYYMLGFSDFVMSNKFDKLDAPDVANCFITLVEDKLKNNPNHILPIIDKILNIVEHVAKHQDFYGAAIHIYGDFQDKLKLIKDLIKNNPMRCASSEDAADGRMRIYRE